jgi:hypothetical protein
VGVLYRALCTALCTALGVLYRACTALYRSYCTAPVSCTAPVPLSLYRSLVFAVPVFRSFSQNTNHKPLSCPLSRSATIRPPLEKDTHSPPRRNVGVLYRGCPVPRCTAAWCPVPRLLYRGLYRAVPRSVPRSVPRLVSCTAPIPRCTARTVPLRCPVPLLYRSLCTALWFLLSLFFAVFRRTQIIKALPDLLGLLYHVDQQLENRLSLKPHLDAVDNDI